MTAEEKLRKALSSEELKSLPSCCRLSPTFVNVHFCFVLYTANQLQAGMPPRNRLLWKIRVQITNDTIEIKINVSKPC